MSADLPAHMRPERSFQGLILTLQRYWADYGCVILQPYDMEVGAGTFHPATTLRALGPKPWNAAYVQPSRRPKDGRYGENPNRLQHYYQFQVILKPTPPDLQDLYLKSLDAIGIDPPLHDIRFVEDDWESPTLGAWGLGWECWCDGMEVSQFTYFQQVAGFECAPVSGELTYGLERLAMYVQGVDNVYDLNFNGRDGDEQGHLWRRLPAGRAGIFAAQFRVCRHRRCCSSSSGWRRPPAGNISTPAGRDGEQGPPPDGAAGLRPVHQGEPRLQPARRARRHLGHRAPELHPARARTREGLRRGVACTLHGGASAMSEMMPEIGGRAPMPIEVEAGKSYWWCACGRSKSQPFCDGSHKGSAFTPIEWKAQTAEKAFFCTCKRIGQQAVVRRQPQEAADLTIES